MLSSNFELAIRRGIGAFVPVLFFLFKLKSAIHFFSLTEWLNLDYYLQGIHHTTWTPDVVLTHQTERNNHQLLVCPYVTVRQNAKFHKQKYGYIL